MARGSGVINDLRKTRPYEIYENLDFQAIYHTDGDCYARYLIRMQEMRESLKIILQTLKEIPNGPILTSNSKLKPYFRQESKYFMEGTIHRFKNFSEGPLILPN